MDNLGVKRPKVIDCNPSLEPPQYAGSHYDTRDIYNVNSRARGPRSVDVLNTSPIPLSVMYSDGMVVNIPQDNQSFKQEATVIVRYEISGGATIPWANVSKNLPEQDIAFIQRVKERFDREANNGSYAPCTVEFYYIVDISDLDYRPNGIYIKPADVQLVSTRHLDVAVPYRRQAQIGIADFNDDEGVSQAATCMAAYVVHDPNDRETLFMVSTTGLVVLDPVCTQELPEGVHLISIGGRRSPGDTRTSEVEHIPIADFRKRLCFRGLDNFNNNFDRETKSLPKGEVDKMFKRMQEFLNQNLIPPQAQGGPKELVDIRCFFGHSLKEVISVLDHALKLKTNIEKLVS